MASAGNSLCLPSGTQLEEYLIDGVLGKGGFAITYSGVDQRLQKRVAIKELLPDGIATRVGGGTVVPQTESFRADYDWAIESFIKEAQTIAGFEHPNIVRVSRFFRQNGTAYMVMPFIEGSDLKALMKKRHTFSYQEVLEVLNPLLGALKIVHEAGVLHRDIKPDNIYVTSHGVPILIDFGAARQQVTGKSMDVTSIITPGYAAIEQYSTDAKYQGPWSDIYGLAAVVHHMITGKKPYPASERSDAARNGLADPLAKLTALRPGGFPPQFLSGIDQALETIETQRPRDVATWMGMLGLSGAAGSYANSIPTHAGPLTSGSPSNAPSSRQPNGGKKDKRLVLILASIVLLLALGLGAGAVVWTMNKSNKAADTPSDPKKVVTKKPSPEDLAAENRPALAAIEAAIQSGNYDKALRLIRELDRKTLPQFQRRQLADLRDLRESEIKNCPAYFTFRVSASGVQVYVDGSRVGSSDGKYKVKGIRNHRIRLSAQGYEDYSKSLSVTRKNQVVDLGYINLELDERSKTAKRNADAKAAADRARARARARQDEIDRIDREKAANAKKSEVAMKAELLKFVNDYYQRMPNNNLDMLVGHYADRVDYEYYKKGQLITRRQLASSLSENVRRWPNRSYKSTKVTYKVLNASQTKAILYFSYTYSYSNHSGKRAKGSAYDDVTVDKINGRWLITKWRQGVKRTRNDQKGL